MGALVTLFFSLGFLIGLFVMCLAPDNAEYWVKHLTHTLSLSEKAARERDIELDKRAAQIIREQGLSAADAIHRATKEYEKDMRAAL
jgi:hypothetical protein